MFCLERGVKPKKLLRFYFGADSLERAFDNLILCKAYDFGADTVATAERICAVIGDKMKLERLWGYLDCVISTFSDEEKKVLSSYSARRDLPLSASGLRAVKRAVIKFTRRARRLCEFEDCYEVLKRYYCLIGVKK